MGCPLNTKGMISICNFETKQTKRIRPNEKIPDGWIKGNFKNKNNQAAKGFIYIYNPVLKIRKRIKKEMTLPEGFVLGYGKRK